MIAVKHSAGDEWVVSVQGAVMTHHRVRVTKADMDRLSEGRSPEELIEESFRFLSSVSRTPQFSALLICLSSAAIFLNTSGKSAHVLGRSFRDDPCRPPGRALSTSSA